MGVRVGFFFVGVRWVLEVLIVCDFLWDPSVCVTVELE